MPFLFLKRQVGTIVAIYIVTGGNLYSGKKIQKKRDIRYLLKAGLAQICSLVLCIMFLVVTVHCQQKYKGGF
jgi:hypothetical protein